MANRLFIDIKEDCHGNLTGPVKFPADSVFVFEALAEVVRQYSAVCEVPPREILNDLLSHIQATQ